MTVDTASCKHFGALVGALLTQGANKIWPKPFTPADLPCLRPHATMRPSKRQHATAAVLDREMSRLEVPSAADLYVESHEMVQETVACMIGHRPAEALQKLAEVHQLHRMDRKRCSIWPIAQHEG